ncbi:MAG: hypothetical protein JNM89_02005 [Hyphomicrobiaceae bacterium]|nr:hypothetical protein [Hyphomicrobiaceae bacterium]
MQLDRTDIVYGGGAGALIGIGYQLGRAWWEGDVTAGMNSGLLAAAAVGAAAGVLALTLRRER